MRQPTPQLDGTARGRLPAPPASAAETGAVTAETALVLPVLVVVAVALGWLVSLGAAQVRVLDAAREVARAVARDEPRARALEVGARIAPAGSQISVHDEGRTVRVVVAAEVTGPAGLFQLVPGVRVDADASAAKEAQ